MKNLIQIKCSAFKQEMDKMFNGNENITTKNILDVYLMVLSKETDVLKGPDLRKFFYQQCQHNCVFEKQV